MPAQSVNIRREAALIMHAHGPSLDVDQLERLVDKRVSVLIDSLPANARAAARVELAEIQRERNPHHA